MEYRKRILVAFRIYIHLAVIFERWWEKASILKLWKDHKIKIRETLIGNVQSNDTLKLKHKKKSFFKYFATTVSECFGSPQPVIYHSVHSKLFVTTQSPSSCASKCRASVCLHYRLTSWLDLFSAMLRPRGHAQPPPFYLYLRPLPPARSGALLTMSRTSTDGIWSYLRKRTGTITLFSFFRWVPSERRKEGRGEEVNKPSAFLQKNKETLDRHLYLSVK